MPADASATQPGPWPAPRPSLLLFRRLSASHMSCVNSDLEPRRRTASEPSGCQPLHSVAVAPPTLHPGAKPACHHPHLTLTSIHPSSSSLLLPPITCTSAALPIPTLYSQFMALDWPLIVRFPQAHSSPQTPPASTSALILELPALTSCDRTCVAAPSATQLTLLTCCHPPPQQVALPSCYPCCTA